MISVLTYVFSCSKKLVYNYSILRERFIYILALNSIYVIKPITKIEIAILLYSGLFCLTFSFLLFAGLSTRLLSHIDKLDSEGCYLCDMEKYNEAAISGWCVIRVLPAELLTFKTVRLVIRAIKIITKKNNNTECHYKTRG